MMSESGLSPGRSGNVSARIEGGMLITPSGKAYNIMEPDDIVAVGSDGTPRPGSLKPSSEWRFHLKIYEVRPDVRAIVHCHSLNATALACTHRPIPAFHYMVAVAGGKDIPLAPYATFGTPELAANIAAVLTDRKACLLANHGQIATGTSLAAALELAHEIETLAAQYIKVLGLGETHLLDDEEMDRVLARFRSYGQNAPSAD